MAVHGKFGKPCPVCGEPVQRIVYAHNEANYCARCQTGGRLLSDRALSRLLGPGLAADARRNGDPEARLSRFAGVSRLHGHGEYRAVPALDQVQRRRRPRLGPAAGRGRARWFAPQGVHYLWATAVGIEAAVLHNFCWHERWTWADRRTGRAAGVALRLLRFHAANALISLAGSLMLTRAAHRFARRRSDRRQYRLDPRLRGAELRRQRMAGVPARRGGRGASS